MSWVLEEKYWMLPSKRIKVLSPYFSFSRVVKTLFPFQFNHLFGSKIKDKCPAVTISGISTTVMKSVPMMYGTGA